MIRIHQVHGSVTPADQRRLTEAQSIFREHFQAVADYADTFADHLDHPFKYGYRSILLVCQGAMGQVKGFSLFLIFPEINSALLDFMAVRQGTRGGGVGGALYEATREYCRRASLRGLYMEVLPDDPALVKDPRILEENRKRLAFYRHYGVNPIVGTEYETPIGPDPAPYLLFDSLDRTAPLRRSEARAAVRIVLTRKYSAIVAPDYIERVVESFIDDPVRFRASRIALPRDSKAASSRMGHLSQPFTYVVGDGHAEHHVRDIGYVERPARVDTLKAALARMPFFDRTVPIHFGEAPVRAVHDPDFVSYLKRVCTRLEGDRPVYPYVFPIRRPERKPRELAVRAGYYCIDTFTPLDRHAYSAARGAVDVALTAARELSENGRRVAFALCRPPGHHAERRVFGGFCYFNNIAIAAHDLARFGRVAILDIDFHHGNGTQDIFYRRSDVLTISIHGHPNTAYPYFSGFADERGEGPGLGFNRNFPLPENSDDAVYLQTLDRALAILQGFRPMFVAISLGLDIMRGDPTGSFTLAAPTMRDIARKLGLLNVPLLVVLEGGYNLRNLRSGVTSFFSGLAETIEK